jgi:hypothetical protein
LKIIHSLRIAPPQRQRDDFRGTASTWSPPMPLSVAAFPCCRDHDLFWPMGDHAEVIQAIQRAPAQFSVSSRSASRPIRGILKIPLPATMNERRGWAEALRWIIFRPKHYLR